MTDGWMLILSFVVVVFQAMGVIHKVFKFAQLVIIFAWVLIFHGKKA